MINDTRQSVRQFHAIQPLGSADFVHLGNKFIDIAKNVVGPNHLLRSFDYENNAYVERKVEGRPDLLSDCTVILLWLVIKVQHPEEKLGICQLSSLIRSC
jgi:hypothetical protein